eukprot:jgi/Hompol1/4429/HPOL_007102-RA
MPSAKKSTLNDWLSYNTVKVVTVRDWRLGAVYYATLLCVVIWVIYNMLVNGTYLIKVPPVA